MSGTMVASAMVGIPIFVTGGIGGVHHGAERSEFIEIPLRFSQQSCTLSTLRTGNTYQIISRFVI